MRVRFKSNNPSGKVGIGGKIFGLLFGLIFCGVGLLFTVMIARSAWQAVDSYSWPEVPCTVRSSSVKVDNSSESPYSASVTYSCSYQGKDYTSSSYSLNPSHSGDYSDAQRIVDRYRAGSQHTGYVNPADPNDAILERGGLWQIPLILFPLLFVAIGAFVVYAVFQPAESETPVEKVSISEEAKKKSQDLGGWGLAIGIGFFFIFFAVGMVAFYFTFAKPFMNYLASASWQERPAIVESSRVRSHSSDDGTTYSVDILYRYSFNGKSYKSNRYDFFGVSTSGYSSKREVVDDHPPGKEITILVDPNDPVEAVIRRELGAASFLGLFTLLFVLVGGGGMYGVWAASRKKRSAGSFAGRLSGAVSGPVAEQTAFRVDSSSAAVQYSPSGEVVLQPTTSAVGKLIGAIVVALIWNGIIAFPIYEAITSWQKGSPEWFLTIVMLPFALIGLLIIGAVFYCFLGLFNPKPKLFISSTHFTLGETISLRWEFQGSVRRIKELTFVIEGIEEASYRRGTSTYTDTETFYKDTFERKTFYREMKNGSTSVRLPENTMHSFSGGNNTIKWRLGVRGDIPRWPDVSEYFELTVEPGAKG